MGAGVAAALLLIAGGGGYAYLHGANLPLIGASSRSDDVGQAERAQRAAAFAALGTFQMSAVPDDKVAAALDGMQLSPDAKAKLAAALSAPPAKASAASSAPVSAQPAVAAAPAAKAPAAQPAPAPAAEPVRTRLAWIVLWDTDAEDGDVVRLDSGGYSRTVMLAKAPITFAVPVTADGVINVTGIRDGEGGGITVGLASGDQQAVFPIMSVGQALGLRVRMN